MQICHVARNNNVLNEKAIERVGEFDMMIVNFTAFIRPSSIWIEARKTRQKKLRSYKD